MSTKKKIILLAGVICYVAVIYGYLAQDTTFMMVSVIVYGVLMLLFALTGEAKKETAAAAAGNVQEEAGELAMKTDALEKRLRELTEEKNRYAKELEEATAAKEQAIAQRDEAVARKDTAVAQRDTAAAQKETVSAAGQELLSNLLPPLENGEKEKETIDIIRIAKETAQELRPFAQKAQLDIRISAPEEHILVRADSARLRILFRNIIDNSIKYMNRAGSLVITISNLGDDIFIVLKDNGNGLPENETAHIFELNYQGSNRISGNGLGLTQAKAIVDYYGGTIYAKSTPGKGMGIYVQLPTD